MAQIFCYTSEKSDLCFTGVLFTDSEFPATALSISPNGSAQSNVVWKRPHVSIAFKYLYRRASNRRNTIRLDLLMKWCSHP